MGMKYALTVSITAVILLLAIITFLLLKMSHGQISCEFQGAFNNPLVIQSADDGNDTEDNVEQKPLRHKAKRVETAPLSNAGIPVNGLPSEPASK